MDQQPPQGAAPESHGSSHEAGDGERSPLPTSATTGSDAAGSGHRRRSWIRWVADLMIVGGILIIPGYFLGSCGYTWLQQREFREELEAAGPGLTVSVADIPEAQFVTVEPSTSTTVPASTLNEETSAAEAAIAAAKAERDAQLAAFKAAADAFAAAVSGRTRTPLGRIVIPSIDLDVVMLEGTSKADLKEGPGHWEETPFPGQGGNFVVSGHRTTYGAPFFNLDDVKVGDEIQLIMPYVVARYVVTKTVIVYPDEVETVRSAGREQVSLAACHPLHSAKQRIVVIGDLTGFKLVEPGG